MQVKQIIIEKEGMGKLQVNANVERSGFSVNTSFGPKAERRTSMAVLVFVADLVPVAHQGRNTLRLVNQVTTSEGSHVGSATWQIPTSTAKGTDTLLSTIEPGVYPLGTRLHLGPVGGKPVTVTVSEGEE